ncbi:hypothetical protein OAU50_00205 [Planctomycetota bacterium]|nr:hypothetical protein [Planctomycetota bacterium]
MSKWLALVLMVFAAPAFAQEDSPAPSDPPETADATDWEQFDIDTPGQDSYQPVRLGKDKTGMGVVTRLSFGYDDNMFKLDRHDEAAMYGDFLAQAWFGADLGVVSAGVRASVSGRMHFFQDNANDADMFDMTLGGFVKLPYGGGGFGAGLSVDLLYNQLQWYDLGGPITRRDDMKAAAGVARAYVGYKMLGFLIPELAVSGWSEDFNEEENLPSFDSITYRVEFGLAVDVLGIVQIRPYGTMDWESFREQLEIDDDGSIAPTADELALLNFTAGADVKADLLILDIVGKVWWERQDDDHQGFLRFNTYGATAVVQVPIVPLVDFVGGGTFWSREYEKTPDDEGATAFERHMQLWGEATYEVMSFMHIGARYSYERRTSDFDGAGFITNQLSFFVQAKW